MNWLQRIAEIAAREGPVARVVILQTTGPTPRSVGAAMLVWATGLEGKIGRGEVEARAIAAARGLIAEVPRYERSGKPQWTRTRLGFPTGDVLGASTGGRIEFFLEVFGPEELAALDLAAVAAGHAAVFSRKLLSGSAPQLLPADAVRAPEILRGAARWPVEVPELSLVRVGEGEGEMVIERLAPARPRFHVYGTGLVARALVKLLADLPFEVVWIDTAPGHFPPGTDERVRTMVSDDPERLARQAAPGGLHAVMTADHDCDLAVIRALVQAGGALYLGVIGSPLKRERLVARLMEDGCNESGLDAIACPIGLPGIRSKNPAVVAVAIAAQALTALQAHIETDQHRTTDPAGMKR